MKLILPEAAKTLTENVYMDDICTSVKSEDEAHQLTTDIDTVSFQRTLLQMLRNQLKNLENLSRIFTELIADVEGHHESDFDHVSHEFLDGIVDFVSQTKRRLDGFKTDVPSNSANASEDIILPNETDICFVKTNALSDLVKVAKCASCDNHSLSICEERGKRKGLATVLSLHCQNECCPTFEFDHPQRSVYTSEKTELNNYADVTTSFTTRRDGKSGSSRLPFAINLRLALASRAIGIGYFQLRRFFAILGIGDFMHLKTFQDLNTKLHTAAKDAVARNLQEVRKKVSELYESEEFMQDTANLDQLNKNKYKTPLKHGDIGVMYDGTWQKRGKGLSHNGICNAIEVSTGYLLDYEVMSNLCQGYLQGPDEDSPEYETWIDSHKPKCQKNTDSSAHNMEIVGAQAIWSRSEKQSPPLRYRSFLSDGDSAAFLAVKKLKPYGDDDIVKEDCANHVAKRFGTALRKVTGLPRGHSLKEHTIKKLSLYYRIAVSSNKGDVQKMYQAIWASYLHSASSDEAHNHRLCPSGEDSWCQFNQAVAKGDVPPPHKPRLSKPQAEGIIGI